MRLAAVVWNNQKAYFFADKSYVRYDIANDCADSAYPRNIQGNWKGLAEAFPNGIDAAVNWNNGFAYFFKGKEYVKYNMDPKNEGVTGKGLIKGNWKGLAEAFPDGVDAAVNWGNGFAYFFKGKEYVKYNMDSKNEGVVGKGLIKGNWKGLAEAFPDGIDAVIPWPNGNAYFFRGSKYVSYTMDPKKEGVNINKPKDVKGNWCGLFGGPFGDPDATVHYSQPANFFVFDKTPGETPDQSISPGTNGMFMVYRIESIQNNTDLFAGSAFDFELANVFAATRAERSGNSSLDQYLKSAPDKKNVPSGEDVSGLGTIVVVVNGDPQSLKTAAVPLHYCQAGTNVAFVRSNANQNPQFLDPMTPQLAAVLKKG